MHEQTSQPHALAQRQRGPSARSAAELQLVQVQAFAGQDEQEQVAGVALIVAFVVADMGHLGRFGAGVAATGPFGPRPNASRRGRRSSLALW